MSCRPNEALHGRECACVTRPPRIFYISNGERSSGLRPAAPVLRIFEYGSGGSRKMYFCQNRLGSPISKAVA